MDKQLLKALDNLSESLEQIALALDSKKEGASATGAALKGGDFGKQLEAINSGIKSIKGDTQEILKNQKTIIALQKEKSKNVIEETGTDKKKESSIKKGVGTILLIAVAVLAIGLALKLIGPVDILSAIGLGLAMVAIGFAFAKVAEATKGYSLKDIALASAAMVLMSIAIALSSWALSLVKPISFLQAVTAIFIGGVFAVVAHGMRKFLKAFKGVSFSSLVKSVLFLPLILPAIALGIALASYAFGLVKPIGFSQVISSIFIAAIFSVVAFGIRNMLQAFKGMNPKDLIQASIFLPLILPAIALGIAGASYALALVQPVGLMQWFTSVLIGILFVVLSFGMVNIVKAMNKMEWGSIVKLPLFFTLISTAIMISSHILQFTADISWKLIFKIAALGILLAGITFALAKPMKVLGKMGVVNLLKGGLAILIIATAIMVSSHILALGNYETFPGLDWIIGVGLSLLTFGLAAFGLGFFVFGPQALIFFAGLGAILAVSATILAVSHVLAKGKYDNKGMLEWAMATSLLYLTFTPIIMALGMMGIAGAIIQFFGGDDPFEVAKGMMVQIAETIVLVSQTLKRGTYRGGPTKEWAEGISLSLGAFMPVYRMLMMNSIMSFFGGGGVGPDDFTRAIITVSGGIISAAEAFSNASVAFANPPPVKWAKGVGLAIGAFSPVYKVLSEQDGWIKDGPSVADMENAIISISYAIIASAKIFAENSTAFSELYPSAKWGKGVGAAIGAFSPVFEMLSGKSWFSSSQEVIADMVYGIRKISYAIIDAGRIFNSAEDIDWSIGVPTKKWAKNVAGAIEAFDPVFSYMNEGSGWFTSGGEVADGLAKGIRVIVGAIANAGQTLAKVKDWDNYPTNKWSTGVRQTVKGIIGVVDWVKEKYGGGDDAISLAGKSLESLRWSVINSMVKTAKLLYSNQKYFKFQIDKGFVSNISGLLNGFVDMGVKLEKKLVTMVKKTSTEKGILGGESTTTEMVKSTKDMGIIDKVALAMVSTAKILYRGRKFFKNEIDPNFIKKLSKNIIDYTRLAEYLTKVEDKESGIFDGIMGAFGISNDPIMKIASGMVVLAKSYDKLSSSFEKFGVALEKINMEKLREVKSLQTEQLANDLQQIKSEPEEDKGIWANMKSSLGWSSPSVGENKTKKSDIFDKTKYGKDGKTMPEQLDVLINILSNIDHSTQTIDEYISSQDASIVNTPPKL